MPENHKLDASVFFLYNLPTKCAVTFAKISRCLKSSLSHFRWESKASQKVLEIEKHQQYVLVFDFWNEDRS